MRKVILFDMDGVITDTEKLHYNAYRSAFRDVGYEVSYDRYVLYLQARSRDIGIRNIIVDANANIVNKVSKLKDFYYIQELDKGLSIYGDTLSLINTKNIRMAVVSASKYASSQVEKLNLEKYFDLVVSGVDTLNIRNKPYPDIYLYAMKTLGVKAENAIIIEDSNNGVTAALDSGAKVIGVNRGYLSIKDEPNLSVVESLIVIDGLCEE